MRRRCIIWLLAAFCLLAPAGCGRKAAGDGDGGNAEEIVLTGEYAPVAEFAMLSALDGRSLNTDCFYLNDEVFYLDMKFVYSEGEQRGHFESSVMAVAADGKGEPRVAVESSGGFFICQFYVDKEGSLYLYERKTYTEEGEEDAAYCLRKVGADGEEAFRADVTEVMRDDWFGTRVYADEEGNIALIDDDVDGHVFFFDSQGQYYGRGDYSEEYSIMHHGANNIVHAGDQGYFLWRADALEGCLKMWKVDFSKGTVSDVAKVLVSSTIRGSTGNDYVLFDTKGEGLLISTTDVLLQYDPKTRSEEEILRWDDENIGIDGRKVAQIIWGDAGKASMDESASIDILAYGAGRAFQYEYPMAVSIRYVDKALIPERQEINIGINAHYDDIEWLVRRFNYLNPEYRAVLAKHSSDDLKEMLMYGREVPDLIDITGIGTEWLESKDLLEDLAPYFEKSESISKEDILPEVWDLLERDGRLMCMATAFTLRTMITTADVPEDGWSYAQYLGLAGQYPESRYFNRHEGMQVWGAISNNVLEDFIDWENRECSFDSSGFKGLLEEINSLDYPKLQWGAGSSEMEMEKLMERQVLFGYVDYGSLEDYCKKQWESGGEVKNVGFPTADGEPMFLFSAAQSLAVYAYSPCKEGAWAFLELLLSEGEQTWKSSARKAFPVRADAFEAYLAERVYQEVSSTMTVLEDTSDAQEKLRYMAEHLAINQSAPVEIINIASEELQAYFAGDKTVDEAAEIIQSRVQLYLDEM